MLDHTGGPLIVLSHKFVLHLIFFFWSLVSVSAIFLFLQKHVSEDYKQSVLSVIFRMIKKEDEDHMCVWI